MSAISIAYCIFSFSKQSLFLSDKTSNLQKLTNWVKEDEDEKSNNKTLEDNWPSSHNIDNSNPQSDQRNQHQKARCSAWFAFAF